jgi:hypothetical protein
MYKKINKKKVFVVYREGEIYTTIYGTLKKLCEEIPEIKLNTIYRHKFEETSYKKYDIIVN